MLLHVLCIGAGILFAGMTLLWFWLWAMMLGIIPPRNQYDTEAQRFSQKSDAEKMGNLVVSLIPGALVWGFGLGMVGLSQYITDSWADSCAKSSGLSSDDYRDEDAGAMYATYFSTQVAVHSFSAKTGITSMPAALIFAMLVIGLVVRFKRSSIQDTVQEASSLDSRTLANEEGAE